MHTVDVAESTSLRLLRVMQTAGPINCDVAFLSIKACCALHTAASTDTAKLKKAIKDRAIVSDIIFALLALEVVHVLGSNSL